MIEDVKWLKPEKYNTAGACWIAKDGKVFEGICGYRESSFKYIKCYNLDFIVPDGVCERKPNQQKPVLR